MVDKRANISTPTSFTVTTNPLAQEVQRKLRAARDVIDEEHDQQREGGAVEDEVTVRVDEGGEVAERALGTPSEESSSRAYGAEERVRRRSIVERLSVAEKPKIYDWLNK